MKSSFLFFFLLASSIAYTVNPRFDGLLSRPVEKIQEFQAGCLTPYFLPYNPTVIYIGGYHGLGILPVAKQYPHGSFYIFEPNPTAYEVLSKKAEQLNQNIGTKLVKTYKSAVKDYEGFAKLYVSHGPYGNNPELDMWSSTLPTFFLSGPIIKVPCIKLDSWCKTQAINNIDLLYLDVEGAEMEILNSSPYSVDKAFVIVLKTYLKVFRQGMPLFKDVRHFLKQKGFTCLAHWYHEDAKGEAIFIRKEVYNSMFK